MQVSSIIDQEALSGSESNHNGDRTCYSPWNTIGDHTTDKGVGDGVDLAQCEGLSSGAHTRRMIAGDGGFFSLNLRDL